SGSSPDPERSTYRGESAFSEPETQAIRDFVSKHHFVVSLSYHSYGRMWLYPWGYAKINPPEPDASTFIALGDSCVAYNGYEAGNFSTGTIYQVNGDTDDWLYGEKGIFAFSPEVGGEGQGFFPDTTMIMPLVLENLGPNLYMAYAAGEEPIVKHERIPDFDIPHDFYTLNTTISKPILLTESVALNESSFKIFYKNSVDAPFDSLQLQPTGIEDKYTADIPGDSLNSVIYYYAQASDDSGRTGTSPRGAPAAVDSFQIIPDTVPPAIVYQPVEYIKLSDSLVISAKATDAVGVAKVTLYVDFNDREYQIPMLPGGNDTFTAHLDTLDLAEGDSLQYRIIAVDVSQNENTAIVPQSGRYFLGIYKSILSYDFEDDSTLTAEAGSDWEWGKPTSGPDSAHSGQKLWATGLNGNYSNSSNSILDVPSMELVGGIENAAFSFWHWYSTEFSRGSIWDGGNVKISVDGGSFQVITPEDGYDGVIDNYNPVLGGEPGFGGPPDGTPGWREEIFDLSEYIGHTVQLRFQLASDDNTPAPGWYIDDIEFLIFPYIGTAVVHSAASLPQKFLLRQNYPNPFNSETFIRFELPGKQHVRLSIYNSLGQVIKVLMDQSKSAGRYVTKWDGKNQAGISVVSGIYFYRIETGDIDVVKKMFYLR
ncbi:MAG: T9SS type A sorting domain-containing protein, partial [Calditrichaeota bacterium]|nr:T9SS type A sorting domain-containing protein [Calditrichota bacterium]